MEGDGLSPVDPRESYGLLKLPRLSLLTICRSTSAAGSGKSVLWWVTPRPTFVDVAYIGDQFFDYKGH